MVVRDSSVPADARAPSMTAPAAMESQRSLRLGIAFVGGALSISIGLVLGVITGFYGGVVDDFINWIRL